MQQLHLFDLSPYTKQYTPVEPDQTISGVEMLALMFAASARLGQFINEARRRAEQMLAA